MPTTVIRIALALGAMSAFATPVASGTVGPTTSPATYIVPGALTFPEGIVIFPETRTFYVAGNLTGEIYRGHLDQEHLEVFLPPAGHLRTQAAGMARGPENSLVIAGTVSLRVYIHEIPSGALRRVLVAPLPGLLNEVTIAPDGTGYVTDSLVPVIYRIPAAQLQRGGLPVGVLEPWLPLLGTPIAYEYGLDGLTPEIINLNGIVATDDGRFLITVQNNTGRLYRIDRHSRQVIKIEAPPLQSGDGLVLEDRVLWVVLQDGRLDRLRLNDDFSGATLEASIVDPRFAHPTSAARDGERMLVVNSQIDRLLMPFPEPPFTVSAVDVGPRQDAGAP